MGVLRAVAATVWLTPAASGAPGTTRVHKGNPVKRAVRDIQVMQYYAYLNESRFGTVAQVYWGLEPDFSFISV